MPRPNHRSATEWEDTQDSDEFQQTLLTTLPARSGSLTHAPLPAAGFGGLTRLFGSREAKRHYEVMQITQDVTIEVTQAQVAVGIIAEDAVVVGLETEAGFEDTIRHLHHSTLARETAPHYVNLGRALLSDGLDGVSRAGVGHIKRKIADR